MREVSAGVPFALDELLIGLEEGGGGRGGI